MFAVSAMQDSLFQSIQKDFAPIVRSSGMDIPVHVMQGIGEFLQALFGYNVDGALKKVPDALVDHCTEQGIFNVIPAKRTTSCITDTLLVYCKGSDNLLNRLADMLIAVGKYTFRNVIFITSKWDNAVITGSNAQRLQDLFELKQSGVSFCFILISAAGICGIPVLRK